MTHNISIPRDKELSILEDDELILLQERLISEIEQGTNGKYTNTIIKMLEVERELTLREE